MNTQKKIKHLVLLSQTTGKLDGDKILFIAKKLNRKELVLYYKMLYKKRRQEKVIIKTAIDVPKSLVLRLKKLFSFKDIFFEKDSSQIAGFNAQIDDFIFDASLRGYFSRLRKSYDQIN